MIKELAKIPKGTLRIRDLLNIDYVHKASDVVHRIDEMDGIPTLDTFLGAQLGYIGVDIRSAYTYIQQVLVAHCFNDCIIVRTGDVHLGSVIAIDLHPYVYSRKNHKDIVQIYNYDKNKKKLSTDPVRDVSIDKLHVTISGNDKHILHCTEICGYENFSLFANGVDIIDKGESNIDYLISTTNAVNWVIGSPEHPVDPARIGNRVIRINGKKPGSKPSKNIVIHARPGLRLELDDSAKAALTLKEYPHV